VEFLFTGFARELGQLTSVLVDDGIANIALFHALKLLVQVVFPHGQAIVYGAVLQ